MIRYNLHVTRSPSGWIKFHQASTPTAASLVTCCMGIALLWNLYTHHKWGKYLLQDEEAEQVGYYIRSQVAWFV